MRSDLYRCSAQWVVLLIAYLAIAFFAARAGLPQVIFHTDVTYMTSVIAVIFVIAVAYLGVASWRFDRSMTWPFESNVVFDLNG